MTRNTDLPITLQYALKHVENRSVVIMKRKDWHTLVSTPECVSMVPTLAPPLNTLATQVQTVVVIASGFGTQEARLEVFRGDEKDAPYVWNKDQYTIIQTLCDHPQYRQILETAGVSGSSELDECLKEHVFVIKRSPNEFEGHWCQELPSMVKDLLEAMASTVRVVKERGKTQG